MFPISTCIWRLRGHKYNTRLRIKLPFNTVNQAFDKQQVRLIQNQRLS